MTPSWIIPTTAALAILLALTLPQAYGDLEPVLQRCCQSGETWAANHTTCTGPPQEQGIVPAQDRLTCLTSLYICCIRAHRRVHCEQGKEAAKEGRQCGTADNIFRDCCDGCRLGIQAGIQRLPCGFLRFSFGAPWDEAYIDCCEKSGSNQGVSSLQTRRPVCEPNAPCMQICDIEDNRIKCSCYPGYKLGRDQATCEDVDECQLGTHTCNPATEFCSNVVGGFSCMTTDAEKNNPCPPGFTRNQQTDECEDFDECSLRPCLDNGHCINTYGSYYCDYPQDNKENPYVQPCSSGFVYSETNGLCVDVDECGEGIDKCNRTLEICQNSHGSYQCIAKPTRSKDCPAGFKWNDGTGNCEDFDECREDLHDCDADKRCRNTVGGYECDARCFAEMKFDPTLGRCVEKNACVDGLHDCKADEACISAMDVPGGYVCIQKSGNNPCPPGFKPADDNNQICDDINECEEFPDICEGDRETCINGIGSYDCVSNPEPPPPPSPPPVETCPLGYQFDNVQKRCLDVNECLLNLDRCNRSTHECVNHNGSYECLSKVSAVNRCPPGYRTNPRTNNCEDINECSEGRHKCLPNEEQCVNVPGAYRCQKITLLPSCPPGHRFNISMNACRDIDECVEGTHTCNRNSQNCVNAIGSYRCVNKANCPHGYRFTGNKCEDVNECQEYLDDCDRRTEVCVNTQGSYQCQTQTVRPNCGPGYVYDGTRNICTDINECDLLKPCQDDQTCHNTIGSYTCNCPPGFVHDVLTRQCKDVNECQLGQHVCAESQRCDNTVGSYTCVRVTSCGTGYTLNAATSQCEDDDECVLQTHNCGPGFSCRNIQGSFRCDRVTCPPGQKLLSDGSCKVIVCGKGMEPDSAGNCVDVNECARADACRQNQRCMNTVGSYWCQNLLNCSPGYEVNEFGNQCVDVDECARRIYECGPQQTCRNRPGGYICECPRGYALNLQRECEDIDECTRFRGQVCSRMSECINTQGSYICNCKEGFRKADDDKNCVDVDECAETPNLCQQTCNNVWGSYQCSCQPGYTLGADNRSCQDIDECKTYEGHGDLCIGYCVNEPGSFSCSCPPGYRLSSDKRTCQDIDECQEQNVCSGDKQVCLNTRGGYKCNRIVCPPNYVRDKDHRKDRMNSEDTVICRKRCQSGDIACVVNGSQTITYQTIALPAVSFLAHPLILTTMRAVASRRTGAQSFHTDFQIVEGNDAGLFDILIGQGVGSLRLTRAVQGPQELRLQILMSIRMLSDSGSYSSTSRHLIVIDIVVSQHDF